MGDTQRQRLEAREEAILAAAASLFSESGVDGTRMAEIARKADVAEGTVYLYYKNKHELLEAVVDRFWRELTKGAKAAVTSNAPLSQQLTELASYHLHSLIDDFKIVEITSRARQRHGEPGRQLPQIRSTSGFLTSSCSAVSPLVSWRPQRPHGKCAMSFTERWNTQREHWYYESSPLIAVSLIIC